MALFFACVAMSQNAWGHPRDVIKNPGDQSVEAEIVIDASQFIEFSDFTLSSDGQYLVTTELEERLDLWSALVWYWPEIALCIFSLLFAWRALLIFRRQQKTPSIDGPYCRNCSYQIKGAGSIVCPECGEDCALNSLDAGMSLRHCAIALSIVLMGSIALFAGYALVDAPRSGRLNYSVDCWSSSLARWVRQERINWLHGFVEQGVCVRSYPIEDMANPKIISYQSTRKKSREQRNAKLPQLFGNSEEWGAMRVSESNTFAYIGIGEHFLIVDLARCQAVRSGIRNTGSKYTPSWLSDDGSSYIDYNSLIKQDNGSTVRSATQFLVDGSNGVPVDTAATRDINLTVQTHAGWSDGQAKPNNIEYQERSCIIHLIQLDGDWYVNKYMGPYVEGAYIVTFVCAGYILFPGNSAIDIYDLETRSWIARLDTVAEFGRFTSSNSPRMAVSSDRQVVAVYSSNMKKIAVYRIPSKNSGDKE